MTWVRRTVYGAFLAIAVGAAIAGTAAVASASTADAPRVLAAHASSPSAAPRPRAEATTAPTSPQPGTPFPWSTLITAVSTLAAGLGGIWLKDRFDARSDRGQRRRDAYAGLLLSLDELNRTIGAPGTVETFTGTLSQAISTGVANVQRTYFAVYLAGSPRVQPLAGKAWEAAWNIHEWSVIGSPDPKGRTAIEQLEDLRGKLREAAEVFADAARKETAGLSRTRTVPQGLSSTAGNQAE